MGDKLRRALRVARAARVALVLGFCLLCESALAQGPEPHQCVAMAVAGGTPDAITIPKLPCLSTTALLILTSGGSNTSSVPTLAVTGSAPQTIIRANGAAVHPGDLPAKGGIVQLVNNGTNWILLANGPGAGGGGGAGTIIGPPASTQSYLPQWSNNQGTALGAGVPVGNTGVNTVEQLDATGTARAPVNTTTGSFSGALSVGGAITVGGLTTGNPTGGYVGVNAANNQLVTVTAGGAPVAGPGTTTVGYAALWNNTSGTGLGVGLPIATTGASTLLESDPSGAMRAPINTTAGLFSGNLTTNITGSGTQCVQANASGVLSGTGTGCGTGSGGGNVTGPGLSTVGYAPLFANTGGTLLSAGLPVGNTGASSILESDSSGAMRAPVNTTTGVFSGQVTGSQIASTVATGTPPLVIASTTNVPNLSASSLNGNTFASPGPIGGTTPAAGAFTTLVAGSAITTAITGSTQCLQVNTSGVVAGAGVPCNGLSGLTAGQVPIAASAATATSSRPTGTTGNATIIQTDSGGHIAPTIIPNTTVTGGTYDKPSITVDSTGRLTAASTTTTMLSPGLTSNSSVYNTGTQTLAGNATLSTQFVLRPISSSGTAVLASTDGAYCNMPTVNGITVQLPTPGVLGTSSFATCFDQSHSYAVISASGTIYGCGFAAGTTTMDGVAFDAQFITDGTNWKCAGGDPTLLGTYSPSGGTIQVTSLSPHGGQFLDCQGITVSSNGTVMSLYVGEGNTSTPTWMTGSNYAHAFTVNYQGGGGYYDDSSTGSSLLGTSRVTADANWPISIKVRLDNVGSTSIPKVATVEWADKEGGSFTSHIGHAVWTNDNGAIVGLELTGSISGGTCYLHRMNT